jgi:ABC-type glutathione transport system ATPase component
MEFPAELSSETLALVHRLSVTYLPVRDRPVQALDQASLEIRRGELVGILGESGSGKSTLAASWLRLLPSDARYDSGSIQFQGRDLLALSEPELRRIRGAEIVLIPQDPALALNPVIQVGRQIAATPHTQRTFHKRKLSFHTGHASLANIRSS